MGIYSHQQKHIRERPLEPKYQPVEIFENENIRVVSARGGGMEIFTTAFNLVDNQFYTHPAGTIDRFGNVKIEKRARYIIAVTERELALNLISIMNNYFEKV